MKKNSKNIAIIGLGYVGLPLALLASKKGYRVIGVDKDEKKINMLKQEIAPFADKKIPSYLKKYAIEATTDMAKIKDASIIIICVPTPVHENHVPNFEPVKSACNSIAKFIKKGSLIILESTVNPGVSENIVLPILEKGSGLKGGRDFYLAHCPERINPGDNSWNVENIPRVLGSLEKKGLNRAIGFYKSIITAPIKPMISLKEAEAVKVVENSFRDINIAFVNELACSFSRLGIDVVNVIDGAATKPFAFMPHYPGCGVGGHCIPVDPYYLIAYAKKNGFNHDFLNLARRINGKMPEYTVQQLVSALDERGLAVKDAPITILGLSYKPEIDDIRESPAFEIIKLIKNMGGRVKVFDPYVKTKYKNLNQALTGSKAVVIATAHKQFRSLKPKNLKKYGIEIIIDGRNCLDKELFAKEFNYRGIGR